MKLENQVCSLDLAKRLKELGVKQEGLYRWAQDEVRGVLHERFYLTQSQSFQDGWTAFTVAELGEMLPGMIDVGMKPDQMRMVLVTGRTIGDVWRVDYQNEATMPISKVAETEADARAKMLVHLIETGVIKP